MNIAKLNGKQVCILGYGREGKAMEQALQHHASEAIVTIRDQGNGPDYLANLDQFDVVIKSPGIPPKPECNALGDKLTNSTQIFLDSIDQSAVVIGITGSKGKSTTSSLLHHILHTAGKNTILVGNIGEPAITHISEVAEDTVIVMEMSSYQLLQCTRSPQIAVITSFFPEHLDYHGSLEAYRQAKEHITKFQTATDHVFYYADSPGATQIAECSPGIKHPYTIDDSPVAIIDTQLEGTHNLGNIAGASAVTRHLGVSETEILQAVQSFAGLPHRLHVFGEVDGITWVDDAISTTPDSTIAAIHALSPRVSTIILGGKDRGTSYEQLGEVIDDSSIETVILMGETTAKLKGVIGNRSIALLEAHSMTEAVQLAKSKTARGKICLLSPAAPSYDQFSSFEEKGQAFTEAIGT